ncbi:MAG TPA: hypothetical protein VGX76_04840, partial [Pirellulales bacterium]|nr:hypothetical protein [Pirellulales bacterium]
MRSRSWLAQPAAMALAASICLLSAAPAAALITGEFGNKPVQDGGWPTGTLDVANLKSRLGWWEGPPFGGGMYVFLYRESSTADFNAALAAFAKIKAPELLVVFHDGPEESFWLRDHQKPQDQPQPAARVGWTFTVWRPENWHRLYNNPKSYFGSDQEAFRKPVDPPRIDVYLGEGNLVLDDLKLPRGVTVRDERAEAAPFELQEGSFVEGRVYD